ncbi:glycosyltransferase [Acinetobacter wuhouensis]|uniref:Glycosyltransferase n=1 Tax=Acinetobacter wuhouensis TaxID=1879050 RepID=A0A4Q7AMY9_9GAMM|nr:glycosyltransferase [Acinetobacter wuhouensis]RZG49137.1 glycosyltransferase [Acinetobacter wuhouensis]
MLENNKYKISVITATYNTESCIQNLIESLRAQQDKDFEWMVVDGASTDKTLEILNEVKDLNIKIISEPDFGIYDALNKGIKACSGEYYLVAGADDVFFENAINDYKNAIFDGIDLITANIKIGNETLKPKNGSSWRFAQFAWVSGHALGLLIKKDLHQKFGFYSRKFPIAADQLFIKNCCQNGAKVLYLEKIVGEFGETGLSSVDVIGTCVESYRVQLVTENSKWIQTFIFIIRLLRRMKYI